ncbi:MAG: hypothetical protein V1816_27255 [Pseudomonadota bacterium]
MPVISFSRHRSTSTRARFLQEWGRLLLAAAGLFLASPAVAAAGDCADLVLTPRPPAYHIYPDHYAVCPGAGVGIRCYHYHWDWVCEKGDKLYWDRRLEAAAHAACGCPMPEGVAPASPFVSDRAIPGLIKPDDQP